MQVHYIIRFFKKQGYIYIKKDEQYKKIQKELYTVHKKQKKKQSYVVRFHKKQRFE